MPNALSRKQTPSASFAVHKVDKRRHERELTDRTCTLDMVPRKSDNSEQKWTWLRSVTKSFRLLFPREFNRECNGLKLSALTKTYVTHVLLDLYVTKQPSLCRTLKIHHIYVEKTSLPNCGGRCTWTQLAKRSWWQEPSSSQFPPPCFLRLWRLRQPTKQSSIPLWKR